ncbi:hypothetical protein D9619_010147 [Psilocybe cf. subviscida]|uniref:Uncharacterized protein n=1 Tax=Psilocybe cf. subviscida TaxID=2480587 RepID=A0A8H5ASR2_9AGAR|nr:hypothetical protein D9619_010147 [Psilocybe cf. subviscida]
MCCRPNQPVFAMPVRLYPFPNSVTQHTLAILDDFPEARANIGLIVRFLIYVSVFVFSLPNPRWSECRALPTPGAAVGDARTNICATSTCQPLPISPSSLSHGEELILIILATILAPTAPTGSSRPTAPSSTSCSSVPCSTSGVGGDRSMTVLDVR